MFDALGFMVAITIGQVGLSGFMILLLAIGFAIGYFVGARP